MLRTTVISLAALALTAGAALAQAPQGSPPGGPAGGPPRAGPPGGPGGAPAATGPRPPRAPTPAEYIDRPKARGPDYQLAVEAALESINYCKNTKQDISVQVTDSANEPVVLITPNTAGMRSLRLLKAKAVTVYRTGKPSSQARTLQATDPVIAVWGANDGAILFPGSVPIFVGDAMIGAITVSGSGINNDEECAQAGLTKIQARLK
jgi:uncharacterized protein GlcG (DUF336 family)